MAQDHHVESDARFLRYLDLPEGYIPSPSETPLDFLRAHLQQLPMHLAIYFASPVPPRTRTVLSVVRNRRLNFALSPAGSAALSYPASRVRWPLLWEQSGSARDEVKVGELSGVEERDWAKENFMGGSSGQIGGLGKLLSEYEAEREAERMRELRRRHAVRESMLPQVEEEEDESEDEDEDGYGDHANTIDDVETLEQHKEAFARLVQERFVYGMLEEFDYDSVDWDDKLDTIGDRDDEERWFDAEDDDDGVQMDAIDRSGTPDY